jgi:CheY-like chemotaxis protein
MIRVSKILLVEDNKNNLRALTLYLEVMGLIVEQAQDGFEALRKLDHETFDFVVSDIGMRAKRCRSGKAYPR